MDASPGNTCARREAASAGRDPVISEEVSNHESEVLVSGTDAEITEFLQDEF